MNKEDMYNAMRLGVPNGDLPIYLAAGEFYRSHLAEHLHDGIPDDYRKFCDYFLSFVVRDTLDQHLEFQTLTKSAKEFFFILLHAAFLWGYTAAAGIADLPSQTPVND